ncbi:MAG: DUF3237 domain-containing protein [Actinomycetota bacterium]|nr:DUF3237 domain-containing protein [Actinomycetota bacterium]MDH4352914.1 DUF3237 domain-containing protein [Actinomycetota bacterium]
MRLEPMYRVRFSYPEEWGVDLSGDGGRESQFYFVAAGSCDGRISGRFRGSNHPRRRVDGTFLPDFQGVIETVDGATIVFDMRGYGRAYPKGARQIVTAVTHVSDDERYRWLNDTVAVGTGEVRSGPRGPTELVIDVAELVWDGVDP